MAQAGPLGEGSVQPSDVSWPTDTPDIRLGGLILLDSLVHPVPHSVQEDDEAGSDDAEQRDWNVFAVRMTGPVPEDREFGLIGELFVCQGDWQLKVSALVPLQVRGTLRDELASLGADAIAKRFGPWANHVLWDFVSQHARILGASVLRTFPLPRQTPEADYQVPRDPDEDSDSDGEGDRAGG